MPSFNIAHIRERDTQGRDRHLIIIPLEDSFGRLSEQDQRRQIDELQSRASGAGLAGVVCPVWEDEAGRMCFIAPTGWHPYFKSLSLDRVVANINRKLSW